jgi:hypothetical protein
VAGNEAAEILALGPVRSREEIEGAADLNFVSNGSRTPPGPAATMEISKSLELDLMRFRRQTLLARNAVRKRETSAISVSKHE